MQKKDTGRGGIRTHAIEMTGALNQRLRPLGHPTICVQRSAAFVSVGQSKELSHTSMLKVEIENVAVDHYHYHYNYCKPFV